jgi:putative MFS transporter
VGRDAQQGAVRTCTAPIDPAANGIGKILGPVCLALIAGSNDVVSPKATTDAIGPAFLFLAACELAALIAIIAYRKEPHGKPMDLE